MKREHKLSPGISGLCLCLWGIGLALLGGCGGGGNAADPVADDALFIGGAAIQDGAPSQTICDGLMLAGSKRWCKQDDGTVKDMTTNTVWLRDAGCAMPGYSFDAKKWLNSLTTGTCKLADGSSASRFNWNFPKSDALVHLMEGDEPISSTQPRAFQNVVAADYWTYQTYELGDGLPHGLVSLYNGSFQSNVPSWGTLAFTLPYRISADNRAEALRSNQGYALAASSAMIPVAGTSNLFTRRFVNQVHWHFCCQNASYVVLWDWDDQHEYRTYRIWYFDPAPGDGVGYYRIYSKPRLPGDLAWDEWRYLAVQDGSNSPGAQVVAWPSQGGDNHPWALNGNTDHTWQFRNKRSGMCLQWQSNVNGESLVQQPCVPGHPNQSFIAFPRA